MDLAVRTEAVEDYLKAIYLLETGQGDEHHPDRAAACLAPKGRLFVRDLQARIGQQRGERIAVEADGRAAQHVTAVALAPVQRLAQELRAGEQQQRAEGGAP